jgi:hypothetical protein
MLDGNTIPGATAAGAFGLSIFARPSLVAGSRTILAGAANAPGIR